MLLYDRFLVKPTSLGSFRNIQTTCEWEIVYGDGPPFDCLEIGGRRVELGPLSVDEARSRMGFVLFGEGPFSVWFEEVGVGDLEETGLS